MEFSGKKVLVVDDSEHVRFSQKLIFEQIGFAVTTSDSGLDALEKLGKGSYDLVSLDIIMENMDGIECYRKIKSKYPKTECVLVSILSGEERVVNRYTDEIGAYRFIKKPLNPEDLSVQLKKVFTAETETPKFLEASNLALPQ